MTGPNPIPSFSMAFQHFYHQLAVPYLPHSANVLGRSDNSFGATALREQYHTGMDGLSSKL